MILDSLKSFEKYVNLHASFGKVLEFIRKNDLHTLSEGKHVIEEDNIWCTVSTAQCKDESESPIEVHDSFIDIHVVLEGTEIIGFRDRAKCMGVNVDYGLPQGRARGLYQLRGRQHGHLLPPGLPRTPDRGWRSPQGRIQGPVIDCLDCGQIQFLHRLFQKNIR